MTLKRCECQKEPGNNLAFSELGVVYFLAAQQAFLAAQHACFFLDEAFFAAQQPFFAAQHPFFAAQQPFFAAQQPFFAAQQAFLPAQALAEATVLPAHCASAGMAVIALAATTEAVITLLSVLLRDFTFIDVSRFKSVPVARH